MKTKLQAAADGYDIDNHAPGRPLGYKGPRFAPTTIEPVLTDLEAEMLDILRRAGDAIEALDGTTVENEKLVDDYRALMARLK